MRATDSTINWQGPALEVLGVSGARAGQFSADAEKTLLNAEIIIGSERQLQALVDLAISAKCCFYPSPLSQLEQLLDKHLNKRVVLLASGDPLLFGIGSYLIRLVGRSSLRFTPALSSIQIAFNRLALDWQQAKIASLHGRPLERIRSTLVNQQLLAFLTDHNSTPQHIAAELKRARLDHSRLWVCEALDTPEEKIREFSVQALLDSEPQALQFHPLHVTIVKTAGQGAMLPEFPGIDDRLFTTGEEAGAGMISKREVRLAILSLLQPTAQDVAWDVGAGCGGVAIEWARWNPTGRLYAIEQHQQRIQHLYSNREQFGVDANMIVVEGHAPEALHELPTPNAVFIGGSGGRLSEILELCWHQLKPGGRLVASAVTEQTRAALLAFSEQPAMNAIDSSWTQIQVSRGDTLGNQLLMRPKAPVLLMCCQKPWHSVASEQHSGNRS